MLPPDPFNPLYDLYRSYMMASIVIPSIIIVAVTCIPLYVLFDWLRNSQV